MFCQLCVEIGNRAIELSKILGGRVGRRVLEDMVDNLLA